MMIQHILIIGCGTLGLRIGLRCALDGYSVKMYDLKETTLQQALIVQDKILRSLQHNGEISGQEAAVAKTRIQTTIDPILAATDIDLVSESVTEDVQIKQKVFATFAPLFPEKTIITTNTSYLLPSLFAQVSGRPDRFCALHFHDVFFANVVDVMPHPGTATWVCDHLIAFGKTIHQIPVFIKNETPGYLFNAMLMACIGAAGNLLTNDLASVQDIDRSWMGNTKMKVGPFGILDTIGLDTVWHVVSHMQDQKSQHFAALIQSYIDQGKLGLKAGKGFYNYPNPEYQNPDFL